MAACASSAVRAQGLGVLRLLRPAMGAMRWLSSGLKDGDNGGAGAVNKRQSNGGEESTNVHPSSTAKKGSVDTASGNNNNNNSAKTGPPPPATPQQLHPAQNTRAESAQGLPRKSTTPKPYDRAPKTVRASTYARPTHTAPHQHTPSYARSFPQGSAEQRSAGKPTKNAELQASTSALEDKIVQRWRALSMSRKLPDKAEITSLAVDSMRVVSTVDTAAVKLILHTFDRLNMASLPLFAQLVDRVLHTGKMLDLKTCLALINRLERLRFTLSEPHSRVLDAYLLERMGSFKPEECIDVLSRYSQMRLPNSSVMNMLAERCIPALPGLSTPFLVRLLLGFSMVSGENVKFFEAVAVEVNRRISELTPKEVANILSAFARRKYYPKNGMLNRLAGHAATLIPQCDYIQLARILYAYSIFRERREELMEKIDQTLAALEEHIPSYFLSTILWSFASLNKQPSKALMNKILVDLPLCLPYGSMQDVCNLAWSLVVLRQFEGHYLSLLCDVAASNILMGQFLNVDIRQLVCVCLSVRLEGGQPPPAGVLRLEQTLQKNKGTVTTSRITSFGGDVLRVVRQVGKKLRLPPVVTEYVIENAYCADAAFPTLRIAIEAHGPWHYLSMSNIPIGHSVLRDRLLHALGWHSIVVYHADWKQLESDEKKMQFMLDALQPLVEKLGVNKGNASTKEEDVTLSPSSLPAPSP